MIFLALKPIFMMVSVVCWLVLKKMQKKHNSRLKKKLKVIYLLILVLHKTRDKMMTLMFMFLEFIAFLKVSSVA